jgi:hypothetical protein
VFRAVTRIRRQFHEGADLRAQRLDLIGEDTGVDEIWAASASACRIDLSLDSR